MIQTVKAVITGDIVNSSRIREPSKLIRSLEFLLNEIDRHGHILPGFREIYKGDSFQVVCEPQQAIRTALLLRAGLIGGVYQLASPLARDDFLDEALDTRLGIGIGPVESLDPELSRAFGPAFTISGKRLQQITFDGLRILVSGGEPERDVHYEVICRLLDILILDWTEGAAQAVYLSLLDDATQIEVAGKLGITQPSVQSRLRTAQMDEIRRIISYFSYQFGNLEPSAKNHQTS